MSRATDAADHLQDRGYLVSASMTAAAEAMRECDLDELVRCIARDLGLKRYHTWNSQKSERGFPDLVIAGKNGILFRELKMEAKKPTPAQSAWLAALREAGGNTGVWRPSDLLSGQIAKELTAIAGLLTCANKSG